MQRIRRPCRDHRKCDSAKIPTPPAGQLARTFDLAGRADSRLVEVIREMLDAETGQSTGTRSRLIRRVSKRLQEIHGPGVVPLPGETTVYALIDRLSVGAAHVRVGGYAAAAGQPTGRDVPPDVRDAAG